MDVSVVAVIVPSGTLYILNLQLKFYLWGCQDYGLAPIHLGMEFRQGGKFCSFSTAQQPLVGQGLLTVEASRSHSESPGQVISPAHRPLPKNTQQLQEADIHAPGGIRNHNPNKWAAGLTPLHRAVTGIGTLDIKPWQNVTSLLSRHSLGYPALK
jgi:hypothetical protein